MAEPFHTDFPTLTQLSTKGRVSKWLAEQVGHNEDRQCLEWPFSKMRFGYGHLSVDGKYYPAHRLMCFLAHGAPPSPSHVAAHNCNNPSCVNPLHLRWSTQKENVDDVYSSGDGRAGEDHYLSFLSAREVIAIRRLHSSGVVQRRIAEAFGVSPQRVNEIIKRKAWKHLHDG